MCERERERERKREREREREMNFRVLIQKTTFLNSKQKSACEGSCLGWGSLGTTAATINSHFAVGMSKEPRQVLNFIERQV